MFEARLKIVEHGDERGLSYVPALGDKIEPFVVCLGVNEPIDQMTDRVNQEIRKHCSLGAMACEARLAEHTEDTAIQLPALQCKNQVCPSAIQMMISLGETVVEQTIPDIIQPAVSTIARDFEWANVFVRKDYSATDINH